MVSHRKENRKCNLFNFTAVSPWCQEDWMEIRWTLLWFFIWKDDPVYPVILTVCQQLSHFCLRNFKRKLWDKVDSLMQNETQLRRSKEWMMKAVFAMTNLFFWVAFSVNVHKGERQQHLMHRSSNINWVRGTQVWVKSEKKQERERGCGESAFGIKQIEEIGRQPEAATVQDTHTHTRLRQRWALVSQHRLAERKECLILKQQTTVLVSYRLQKINNFQIFYFYV